MNTLFAPMVVGYSGHEYVTVGVVSTALPTTFKLKVEKKSLEETQVNVVEEGPLSVEFILQPIGPDNYQKTFQIVPAVSCQFIRFLDQCVMCRAPKLDQGG